jgi:tetratricopeptide (TPR) repeat protein
VTDALAKARAEEITVVARQSTARLRGRTPDQLRQARALRLDYAVAGRLRYAAGTLQVEVELVRVSDEALLWSEQFRARPSLLSRVASEIATAVAAELGRVSALRARSRPSSARAVAPRSYLALLQGQFSSQLRTERGVRRAVELFEHAIAWDPDHAAAHAALADALLMLGFWGFEAPLAIAPRVRSALRRAFAIDRQLAPAHASLAYLRYAIDYQPDAALRAVEHALSIDPDHARSHWIRGSILKSQGRFDAALEAYEAAREIDPFSPMLALDIAFLPFCAQRLEPALEGIRALTAREPEFAIGHAIRATIAAAAGRSEEATRSAEIAEGLARGNALVLGSCAWALAKAGQTAHASALRVALEKKAARRYVAPSYLALAALPLGDTEAALAALERGLENRSMYLPFVGADPRFAALRGDARFERLAAIARGASRAEPATAAELLRAARA